MASLRSSFGSTFSRMCDGEFDLGSYCTQTTIVNVVMIPTEGTNSLYLFQSVALLPAFHILLPFPCLFKGPNGSKNLSHFVYQHTQVNSLSETLIATKSARKSQKTDLDHASFLSKLTFSWIIPLLNLGSSKTLALEDIPSLVSEDEANLAYQKFAHAWDSLSREKSSSSTGNLALRAIAKVYMKENIWIAFCAFLRTISVVVSPLILYAFVNYSNSDKESLSEGITIVGCLILTKLVECLSQRHWFFDSRRSGMKMRSGLIAAIYQKQLKLSSLGRRRHSAGEIVNYIAVDAY
ncbi:hypothetical protein Pyn_05453 [Prunus yedoensis var. nudiflora]|uniref:ABC transmembrane type-1 domain-containing protein n=1 Tax=Prunus yedoensis var. nudiflora TaxID=2094558 RepID=A0A314U910_PRUYE|nr:hypothetical protein Pyn_05453 [Prunus yedoensis var. nudiflora]